MKFLILVVSCIVLLSTAVNIKIVPGVDRKSDKDENKLEFVPPDPMYGPRSLYFLKGSCFTGSFDRFEYSVCPFHNVTQRRSTALKPTLIGVWGNWQITTSPTVQHKSIPKSRGRGNPISEPSSEEANSALQTHTPLQDYYNIMEYRQGRNCGNGDGLTTIYLQCEHSKFEVISVDSEVTCDYALTLGLPLACSLLTETKVGA